MTCLVGALSTTVSSTVSRAVSLVAADATPSAATTTSGAIWPCISTTVVWVGSHRHRYQTARLCVNRSAVAARATRGQHNGWSRKLRRHSSGHAGSRTSRTSPRTASGNPPTTPLKAMSTASVESSLMLGKQTLRLGVAQPQTTPRSRRVSNLDLEFIRVCSVVLAHLIVEMLGVEHYRIYTVNYKICYNML